jgi:hypothetical protein
MLKDPVIRISQLRTDNANLRNVISVNLDRRKSSLNQVSAQVCLGEEPHLQGHAITLVKDQVVENLLVVTRDQYGDTRF